MLLHPAHEIQLYSVQHLDAVKPLVVRVDRAVGLPEGWGIAVLIGNVVRRGQQRVETVQEAGLV